jgi:restriction system protein
MSRRHKQSPTEDGILVAARLPWWLALTLALVGFLILHEIASAPVVAPTGGQELSSAVTATIIRTAAGFAQYFVPFVLICGAGVSAYQRYRNRRLLAHAESTSGTNDLLAMSWRDFEHLVGQAFRERGYSVTETPPGADGGVDLELRKDGELHLVQCKRWRAQKVGVEIVRELYGVMAAHGATGGFVVSTGRFTHAAHAFADGRNIDLMDGGRLKALIRRRRNTSHVAAPAAAERDSLPAPGAIRPSATIPKCPRCGAIMVLRQAHRGRGAGQWFWGCPRFPGCRGTRSTDDRW